MKKSSIRTGKKPFVLGITGSIAMGKSTAARMAARAVRGAVLVDADKVVHQLLDVGGAAVEAVAEAFPETLRHDAQGRPYIDRRALGAHVFAHPERLARLEAELHHRVCATNLRTIRQARLQRRPLVVLEIPLLFETGAEVICDEVWVASAPAFLQRQRAMRRPGMTSEKLSAALIRQMPNVKKQRHAHQVIFTGIGLRLVHNKTNSALFAAIKSKRSNA